MKTSIILPVVVLGIFGNILIIHVLIHNRPMRTPTNLLIGNMAAADLLSLLIHPWVIMIYESFQNYELGPIVCRGESAVECSVLIASVISMSAITYDRLTAIVLPKETRLTLKGARIVMVITWLTGVLLSIPITLYRQYKERHWKNFVEMYCTENTLIINIYWYVMITVLVWLPLSIQIICYISIFIKLNKYEKVVQESLQNQHVSYKKRAARMMFVVTIMFMICRLPFTGLIIYRHQLIESKELGSNNNIMNQTKGGYHTLWFISKYLMYVNSSLNPIIYGVTNEKFRKAFKITEFSKWLFPSSDIITTKTNCHMKATQETSTRLSIFVFFKRKLKIQEELGMGKKKESTEKSGCIVYK
ncbi:unnamed protein product [Acanthoscelides obtectus]|nr:unnamed protein product [Acanthoscelides obtectus]CAK1666890.1 Neuropeptide FF receptor 2 [Acanthoscelides obtectus]